MKILVEGYKFEVFKEKASYFTVKNLQVTLTKRGQIYFNRTVFDALGKPKALILLFDRELRVVGLRPSSTKIKHAYPVGINRQAYVITAKAFCNEYEIDLSNSTLFDASLVNGALVFELNGGTPLLGRKEKPRKHKATKKRRSLEVGIE
jgi:hypothetical protein